MDDFKKPLMDQVNREYESMLIERICTRIKAEKSIPVSIIGSVRKEAIRIIKIALGEHRVDNISDSIVPAFLMENRRYNELNEAIRRYLLTNQYIPVEWLEERNELNKKINLREDRVIHEALNKIKTKNK